MVSEEKKKSLAIVLEWENAQSLEREEALGFLGDLVERIRRTDAPIAKPVTLVLVFDEDVNAEELRRDVESLRPTFGDDLVTEFVLAPDTPYYAKKGIVPFLVKSDVYLYADSDCEYSEHWLSELVVPVLEGKVGVAYGDTVAMPGSNLIERACSLAWFFPLDNPKDPLRAKGKRRFFANNFAVDGDVIRTVPIVRNSGSRAHGAAWMDALRVASIPTEKVLSAVATHKQYGDLSSFFGRAWVFGKDKDVASALANPGRGYRLRRALAAVFELHGKYLARFARMAPSAIPVLEWLPSYVLGIGFQVTANVSQLVACLSAPTPKNHADYDELLQRAKRL